MGCCQSTTSGDEAAPPTEIRASTQSDAALTASRSHRPVEVDSSNNNNESDLSTPASGIIQPSNTTARAQAAPNSSATAKRPNKPIRAPSPLPASPADVSHLTPPWTRVQLAKERIAFFDTRVSGQAEVWTALRLVCELLQQGNVADAQGILDAMGITCPSGRVAIGRGRDRVKGGVYDERGELYELPAWIVVDPQDIVGRDAQGQEASTTHASSEKHLEDDDEDDDSAVTSEQQQEASCMRQRTQKGKGKAADLGEQIRIRLRLSDRGTDILVAAGSKEPVLAIVSRVCEHISGAGGTAASAKTAADDSRKRVRLVYLGHFLQENRSLSAQGYRAGNVINAYVFDAADGNK